MAYSVSCHGATLLSLEDLCVWYSLLSSSRAKNSGCLIGAKERMRWKWGQGSKEFNLIGEGGQGWVDPSDLLFQPSPEEQFSPQNICAGAGAGQSFSQPGWWNLGVTVLPIGHKKKIPLGQNSSPLRREARPSRWIELVLLRGRQIESEA